MSLKDEWKETGKNLGSAMSDLGKSIGKEHFYSDKVGTVLCGNGYGHTCCGGACTCICAISQYSSWACLG